MPAPTKRTTVRPSKNGSVVDVDAILAEKGLTPQAVEDIETFSITLFGEENIRVLKTTNMFNLMMFGSDDNDDTARSVKAIVEMVHPDDQRRFKTAIARQASLSAEVLVEIINQMLSGATGANPTSSSSASGRTAKRSTSRALSAANSSSPE
jgi:hypothetical protein